MNESDMKGGLGWTHGEAPDSQMTDTYDDAPVVRGVF